MMRGEFKLMETFIQLFNIETHSNRSFLFLQLLSSILSSGSHVVKHDGTSSTLARHDDESCTGSEDENSCDDVDYSTELNEEVSTDTDTDTDTDTETGSDTGSVQECENEEGDARSSDLSDDQVDEDEVKEGDPNQDAEFEIEWDKNVTHDGNESDSDVSILVNITMSGSTTDSEGSSISVDDLEGIMEKIQNSDEMVCSFLSLFFLHCITFQS